jgi:hypothetical protein
MAEATFTLRAVDATRAAFAAVQNSLTKLQKTAKIIGTGFATFFGMSAAIGGIKRLDAFLEDAEKNAKKLGLTSEDLDKLTIATGFADDAVMKLQRTTALGAANLAGAFTSGDLAARAFAIRVERLKEPLEKITDEIRKQKVENSLLFGNEGMKVAAIRNQLELVKSLSAEETDILKTKQAELETLKLEGQLSSARNKMQEDQRDLIQEQKDLRVQLNSAVGLERDESKVLNDLLSARLDITREIKNSQDGTDQGLSDENMFRAERNRIDRELIPLLQNRFALEKEIGSVVANSFQTAILEGGKFIDILKQMMAQIVQLVFFETVTKRLAKGLSSVLIGNPFASLEIGPAKSIPFMAEGGPVGAGRPYMVGEKGPELFVPSSSGSIVPNGATSSSGSSGSSVNVTYNIASGVSRAELVPILESERKRLKAEIPDMVRRGGAYRTAFA